MLSFCERPGIGLSHSTASLLKNTVSSIKLDYLLVNQKVKTTGINDHSEQWQIQVLSAQNYFPGAVPISIKQAVRAALWMPFPCLWGRRAAVKECLFSSYKLFSFPIFVVTPLTPPWSSRFLQSDFKMFCGSASGSQPVPHFFPKLFRLVSCSCFQDFDFNKMPTVLAAGVTARQQLPCVCSFCTRTWFP